MFREVFIKKSLTLGHGEVMRSLFVLTAILLVAIPIQAQESAEERITQATAALPEALRDGATVLSFDENDNSSILRQGTNSMICWADDPTEEFRVSCFPKSIEAMMVRRRELGFLRGVSGSVDIVQEEIRSGDLPMPDIAIAYSLRGPRFDNASPLTVIYIPNATPESTGLSTQPNAFQPYMMRPGQPMAHIMIF
tara:strand:+ start:158 stop:742 length:585 start_codon:yes stop_codon:yes gene_type:complete